MSTDGRSLIDTDGILDHCKECGGFPRWTRSANGTHGVQCYECPNAIDTCATYTDAMVRWNREQRAGAGDGSMSKQEGIDRLFASDA